MKGRLSALGIGLGILALAVALAELVLVAVDPDLRLTPRGTRFPDRFEHLRNLHHARDRELLWRPVPGFRSGSLAIDAGGFRVAPTPRGEERRGPLVACLGNSVTFGYTTPRHADTIPARVESVLVEAGCPFGRVVNAGVIGYTSEQGLVRFARSIAPLAPRVVTILFGYNDHHLASMSDAARMGADRPLGRLIDPLAGLRVFRALLKLAHALSPGREDSAARPRVGRDRFRENIESLVARARESGAFAILVTVPLRPGVPLVENPVPLAGAGGEIRYADSFRWLLGQMPEAARAPIGRLVFANEPIDPALLVEIHGALRSAHQRAPGPWPIAPYLLGLAESARGDSARARALLARAGELDLERRDVEAYNEIIREVAAARGAPLVDGARLLAEAERARRPDEPSLFADVVHPSTEGNRLLGIAIGEAVARALGCE